MRTRGRWSVAYPYVVEQDYRDVKRVTHSMRGFKSFEAAQQTLVSIESVHMLRKG
jgi:putative transposase